MGEPSQLDPRPSSHPFQRSRQTNRKRGRGKSPPTSQPPKLPRKIRPRRRKREPHQQHLPGTNGNSPGIDLRPREMKRTPVKHPQPLQHPQYPRPAANKNLSRVNLLYQADHGRLYKQVPLSRFKESTKRSRRDYFSGSSPSFISKWPRRDYFSGSSSHSRACNGPDTELSRQPRAHQGRVQIDTQEGAISLLQSGCHTVSHRPQTPPLAAQPDSVIEVGLESPVAASTSRIPRDDLPPVIPEIPTGSPESEEELSESPQCLDTLGKGFQLPTRSPKRLRSNSPPSPRILESTSPSGGVVSNGYTSLVLVHLTKP